MALGLVVIFYAVFGVRETMPMQAEPIPTSIVPTAKPSATPTPTPIETQATALYESRPELGDRVGTITLPSLKLSWPIFEGTTESQLARGVGHYVKSVLPGETDNSVLAGHRTTVFNRLGELKVKDLILVKTKAGTFTYQIRKFRIVKRTDRTVIVPTDTAVLTLSTCYPFNNIGITDHAYIVIADLVTEELVSK